MGTFLIQTTTFLEVQSYWSLPRTSEAHSWLSHECWPNSTFAVSPVCLPLPHTDCLLLRQCLCSSGYIWPWISDLLASTPCLTMPSLYCSGVSNAHVDAGKALYQLSYIPALLPFCEPIYWLLYMVLWMCFASLIRSLSVSWMAGISLFFILLHT